MNTIIVPTDFSKNAFVAAQYAASLAKQNGSKLLLYHVYIVLYSGFEEKGVSVQHVEWADNEASTSMKTLLETMRAQYPEVEIEGEYTRGFMIDALNDKLKTNSDINLVVMGTKGVTNLGEAIFGSTTYEVLKKAPIPVLVIPGDTPDFSMDHAGFFSDYNPHEIELLQKAVDLLKPVKKFDVIHLVKGDSQSEVEKAKEWRSKLESTFPERPLEVKEIPVEKVELKEVVNIAKEQKLDLLVFTRPHKPFFEKLFGKSLTKAVASYPVLPSLFIKE